MKHNLLKKFEELQDIPFPRDFKDDVLNEIKGELAEYDGYLAGLILSFANGQDELKSKIIYDSTFEDRVMKRLAEDPMVKEDADKILIYLQKIKTLVNLARES